VVETDGLVLGKREDTFRAVVEAIEWSHCVLF
jgi:GTP-dependent phosphoenolpyruvate carboxykinase